MAYIIGSVRKIKRLNERKIGHMNRRIIGSSSNERVFFPLKRNHYKYQSPSLDQRLVYS